MYGSAQSIGFDAGFSELPVPDRDPSGGDPSDCLGKLAEAERRLAMYEWVEGLNDPSRAQHRILLDDSVSAFLLSFEATLQFLKTQFEHHQGEHKFDDWFRVHPAYDVRFKGLRTLRTFQAHVELKPPPRHVSASFGSGPLPPTTCVWRLPKLTLIDLEKLRNPYLKATDLVDWNTQVEQCNIAEIFRSGLEKLKQVLEAGEAHVRATS
jgi:hypothetical protein